MPTSCRFAMGVHALAYLGLRSGECFTSQDIARSTNTNAVVVRRILAALHEAGLVSTQRGPHGGARLIRSPQSISLAEIYRAVASGETFSMHHTPPNKRCPVGGIIQEALEGVFARAQNALEEELERTRLADILKCVEQPEPLEGAKRVRRGTPARKPKGRVAA